MKNPLLIELTNKFIDDELTIDEKSQLMDLLKIEENKIYFDSMTQTINELEKSKSTKLEINIKDAVMNKIKKSNSEKPIEKAKNWFSQMFNGTKLSYAVSFALGGFLVGFIFLLQFTSSDISSNNINDAFLKGVMSDNSLDETYVLHENYFDGAIKVTHSEGIVILDVDLTSTEAIDCELKYDKNQLALYGVKSVESNNNGKFSTGGSSVLLSNLDANHYLVFLRSLKNNASKVQASFYNGNMTVANLTIDIKN